MYTYVYINITYWSTQYHHLSYRCTLAIPGLRLLNWSMFPHYSTLRTSWLFLLMLLASTRTSPNGHRQNHEKKVWPRREFVCLPFFPQLRFPLNGSILKRMRSASVFPTFLDGQIVHDSFSCEIRGLGQIDPKFVSLGPPAGYVVDRHFKLQTQFFGWSKYAINQIGGFGTGSIPHLYGNAASESHGERLKSVG